jgi:hypothetical protein
LGLYLSKIKASDRIINKSGLKSFEIQAYSKKSGNKRWIFVTKNIFGIWLKQERIYQRIWTRFNAKGFGIANIAKIDIAVDDKIG